MLFNKRLISIADESKIISAIKEAELNTSGEIRVHLERKCKKGDPISRAIFVFNAIGMYKTKDRNGVLIYVALESKKFAIIGDSGINNVIPGNFWNNIKEALKSSFTKGEICQGIVNAIHSTGELLKKDFPYQSDDINEQSDEISYGK